MSWCSSSSLTVNITAMGSTSTQENVLFSFTRFANNKTLTLSYATKHAVSQKECLGTRLPLLTLRDTV